ncbi:MAG TPA: hypothetical protein VFV58_39200 [Blastocatellia bacterium]|jgi:hypothetical protein|nr:hypothetical protein [Blastocatellia bacterium]
MFDVTSEIAFEARVASTGGESQEVVLRFPTDAEWITRAKARKIVIRRLGRGISETILPEPGEAEVKLYQAIAINGAPAMTPAEAQKVLESIGTCDVIGVELEGNEADVEAIILNGRVKHHLKLPSADQVVKFRRTAFRMLDMPFNQQLLVTTPEAGAWLYDQCGGKSDDYPKGIPGPHKDAVVRAVIDFIDRSVGPRADDANF